MIKRRVEHLKEAEYLHDHTRPLWQKKRLDRMLVNNTDCCLNCLLFSCLHIFEKKSLQNTFRVSNSLDPVQSQHLSNLFAKAIS